MLRRATFFVIAVLVYPSLASAQITRTLWGVSGGFTPHWEVPSSFKTLFDADEVDFSGSEFQIGFVRGSVAKGDWGVSFVRKNVRDDSRVSRQVGVACPICGVFLSTQSAELNGVEVHGFVPFTTIKDRVQIGMNLAGGVGKLVGDAHQTTVQPSGVTEQTVEASTLFAPGGGDFAVVPLGRVEVAVAAILGPDMKIRASGGLNMPGYSVFNLTFVYLFGAR